MGRECSAIKISQKRGGGDSDAPQLHCRDPGADQGGEPLHLLPGPGAQTGPEHGVPVDEGLKKVPPGAGDPGADGAEGGAVMELAHHGGAELIVHGAFPQQTDALLHRGGVEARYADGFGIPRRSVFHVHGHIVHKALVQDLRQPGRITAVGIQLHGKAQFPHLPQKIRCGILTEVKSVGHVG